MHKRDSFLCLLYEMRYLFKLMIKGEYVHNPAWDLTPFQLWKQRKELKTQVSHKIVKKSKPAQFRILN